MVRQFCLWLLQREQFLCTQVALVDCFSRLVFIAMGRDLFDHTLFLPSLAIEETPLLPPLKSISEETSSLPPLKSISYADIVAHSAFLVERFQAPNLQLHVSAIRTIIQRNAQGTFRRRD